MKTNRLSTSLRPSSLGLIAAAVAVLTIATAANAENRSVRDDGIAASPKVRQMLDERRSAGTTASASAPAMTCPKCVVVRSAAANGQAKGAEILTGARKVAYSHACASCETKWTVAGTSKAKHSVATHVCTADGPNNPACCSPN